MKSDGVKETEKEASVLSLSLRMFGALVLDLPGLTPTERALRRQASSEAQRLAREYEAMQLHIDRYMDSRDAAGDDAGNERILPEDPWKNDPLADMTAARRVEETKR